MAQTKTKTPPVTDMPVNFIECHTMGHQWKHGKPIGIDDQGDFRRPFGSSTGMIGYKSSCGNCGSERIAWVTRSGEKINRYRYQENYSRTGNNRVSHAEYRRTFAAILFDEFTPTQ